eukprot:1142474-Alexandrium_andersonii.AAC.1
MRDGTAHASCWRRWRRRGSRRSLTSTAAVSAVSLCPGVESCDRCQQDIEARHTLGLRRPSQDERDEKWVLVRHQ